MTKLAFSAGLFLLASTLLSFSQPANIYTFPGPDVDLGQSSIFRVVSGGHYIGGRGDTIYVLRQFGGTWCHKSTDGGRTFGSGVLVNSTPGAVNASLKVDTAGVVYVAYQASADIYFTKSTDGGMSFTPGVKVNDDTIPEIGQEKPSIAVNSKGQIFIAWGDQRTDPGKPHKAVFAASSYDGGQTFTAAVQGNEVGTIMSGGIDIAADDSGRTYIAYRGTTGGSFGIVVARSDDSGGAIITIL